jgi:hypothetical protein
VQGGETEGSLGQAGWSRKEYENWKRRILRMRFDPVIKTWFDHGRGHGLSKAGIMLAMSRQFQSWRALGAVDGLLDGPTYRIHAAVRAD